MNIISILKHDQSDFSYALEALLKRDTEQSIAVEQSVSEIIAKVRVNGDRAVLDYTRQFDQVNAKHLSELEVSQDQLDAATNNTDPKLVDALEKAHQRIWQYHQKQKQTSWQFEEQNGTILGQRISPVDRAGIYVPGGKAAYPSSVLMNTIPAKIAGVKEIIMVVPTPKEQINSAILCAAKIAGVNRIFRIGGAQAVAALAYGTETIPNVDVIVGPGNQYVASAKKQVFGKVGIDMIAGPSEVLIICDDSANPDWVAMDLFAQAEHDEMAQSIAITNSAQMLNQIRDSIEKLLPQMPRQQIIRQSLQNYGALILVDSLDQAVKLSNQIAPEHLQLMVDDADALLNKTEKAGAIFCGHYSAESLGDYCAGPNHVLPTSETARYSSPLGVYNFQKRTSIIKASAEGATEMAQIAAVIADSEQLCAHATSARYRMSSDKNTAIEE